MTKRRVLGNVAAVRSDPQRRLPAIVEPEVSHGPFRKQKGF